MTSLYKRTILDFHENFILYIPLTIILQSCIGSIAAMYILMNSPSGSFKFFELTLCVVMAVIMLLFSHKLKPKLFFPFF